MPVSATVAIVAHGAQAIAPPLSGTERDKSISPAMPIALEKLVHHPDRRYEAERPEGALRQFWQAASISDSAASETQPLPHQ